MKKSAITSIICLFFVISILAWRLPASKASALVTAIEGQVCIPCRLPKKLRSVTLLVVLATLRI